MMNRSHFTLFAFTISNLLVLDACTARQRPTQAHVAQSSEASTVLPGITIEESSSAETLPCYEIFELTLRHNGRYENNFIDVDVEVTFTSPNSETSQVKGFYYGSDLWKARFRPSEPGNWTYTYRLAGAGGFQKEGAGSFVCSPGNAEGPVIPSPDNPYRWIFANNKPFFPVGLQKCGVVQGARPEGALIDGEQRDDGKARSVSIDEYFSIYGEAGFNLFRFSQKNCSYPLFDDLDHYRVDESIATDELLAVARKNGFRIMYGFFGFYNQQIRFNPELVEKEKRFIRYSVARWGVYVDFWELLNESEATDRWTTMMADYVRSIDPDRKPIGTSWPKPYLRAIDFNAPHWYESESELQSDLRVKDRAKSWKRAGKPVMVGEQGNSGMNWDPLSGTRMRIRTWTALFQEISLIFWNISWSKFGMFQGVNSPGRAANIYLGPEERGYIRVFRDFTSHLDASMQMVSVKVSDPDRARAYGLRSESIAAVYLHHFENHTATLDDLRITLDLPEKVAPGQELVGAWIDPSTGFVLSRLALSPGRQTIDVPPFTVDLALLVTQ